MEIKPYQKNQKKHPQEHIEQVAASIKEFGMNQPIVVDKQGVIIAGHGRYEALMHLGWEIKDEWVKVVDLTEEQAKAYRLADNKLNESDWNMPLVIEELKELESLGFDIGLTGFEKDLIIEPEEKDDNVPELDESNEPTAKLGDIYQLGSHRVMCGDSTDLGALGLLMSGVLADMWLTDPPYNVDYQGGTESALKIVNDSMSDADFRKFLTDCCVGADSHMKPGAVFYIWHSESEGYNFRSAVKDAGWQVRQCLIWNKQKMVMGRQDYHWKHEPCLYGWKDGDTHLWNSDRKQTTILNFDRPSKNKEHPTMKPVELISYQIQNNTKQKDIVLDSFLGSGSTLIASEKTGRICYGMELDPKYVDVIIKRWEEYTGKKAEKVS